MSADLVCFSHLPWEGVTQRPQHLMAQARLGRRVFVFEETAVEPGPPTLRERRVDGITVLTPVVSEEQLALGPDVVIGGLIRAYAATAGIRRPWIWFWTPAMLRWASGLDPQAIVYDCMDELSAFRGADRAILEQEQRLLARADIVFTGGRSLYEAKRGRHPSVHAFPSSVDVAHFLTARQPCADPADQAGIAGPRIGWFGVIDERFDSPLVEAVALRRPDWRFVLIGPVTKITDEELPHAPNVHLLGPKPYAELPSYLAGWDVAMMPFARNEATRFISPTKTPEYLAGGRPVVSTSIRDVVEPYGRAGLVRIADEPETFEAAVEAALRDSRADHLERADRLLAGQSWAATWASMERLIEGQVARPLARPAAISARSRAASAAIATESNATVAS